MTDLIERVAMAMWKREKQGHQNPGTWDADTPNQKQGRYIFRYLARAAISEVLSALEEPSEGVVEAGLNAAAWEIEESRRGTDTDGRWLSPSPIRLYPALMLKAMILQIKKEIDDE